MGVPNPKVCPTIWGDLGTSFKKSLRTPTSHPTMGLLSVGNILRNAGEAAEEVLFLGITKQSLANCHVNLKTLNPNPLFP